MATDLERQQEGEQFKILDPANFARSAVVSKTVRLSR
jgi:hypothetical protein